VKVTTVFLNTVLAFHVILAFEKNGFINPARDESWWYRIR